MPPDFVVGCAAEEPVDPATGAFVVACAKPVALEAGLAAIDAVTDPDEPEAGAARILPTEEQKPASLANAA